MGLQAVIIFGFLFLSLLIQAFSKEIEIKFDNELFSIYIKKQLWFQSDHVFIHHSNKYFSTKDSTLQILSQSHRFGHDILGSFEEYSLTYGQVQDIFMIGIIKVYDDDFITFDQQFPNKLTGTSVENADSIISGFPTFKIFDSQENAGAAYSHWISWYYTDSSIIQSSLHPVNRRVLVAPGFINPLFGEWNSNTSLQGGIGGTGVTAIYDKEAKVSSIFSSMVNPMVISQYSEGPGIVQYGIMGNVTEIPANFNIKTILSVSTQGVNKAMLKWGNILRRYYNKPDATEARKKDLTLQYLGFTTDNGAYYYYHTQNNSTYEDTILMIYDYAKSIGLPYHYILLDSWWYYKGTNGGVSNWSAQTDLFPHGLEYVYEKTKWKIQAHNRYWALDNNYSKNYGGSYEFIEDNIKQGSVPAEERFWYDLLSYPQKNWGLIVYEQDWLFNEFYQYVGQMLSNVNLARDWLLQMGKSAQANHLTIQYCMPYVRHIIQSLEVSVVTQTRASDDYVVSPYEGVDNWRIGGQSLLIDALGMAPSKDGYWSSTYQPGNPYGEDRFEPYPRLQSAVTALSAGPVAIADGIGYSDVELIMKSCMKDGRLLQPSSPATMIDKVFLKSALPKADGPDGEVWFAPSYVSHSRYGSLFVADLSESYSLFPQDVNYNDASAQLFYVRESNNSLDNIFVWSNSRPLVANKCGYSDFQVYSISPQLSNGWTFLGEITKWTAVSPARFKDIQILPDGLVVHSQGVALENIVVGFVSPNGQSFQVTCQIPEGKNQIAIHSDSSCI